MRSETGITTRPIPRKSLAAARTCAGQGLAHERRPRYPGGVDGRHDVRVSKKISAAATDAEHEGEPPAVVHGPEDEVRPCLDRVAEKVGCIGPEGAARRHA